MCDKKNCSLRDNLLRGGNLSSSVLTINKKRILIVDLKFED